MLNITSGQMYAMLTKSRAEGTASAKVVEGAYILTMPFIAFDEADDYDSVTVSTVKTDGEVQIIDFYAEKKGVSKSDANHLRSLTSTMDSVIHHLSDRQLSTAV